MLWFSCSFQNDIFTKIRLCNKSIKYFIDSLIHSFISIFIFICRWRVCYLLLKYYHDVLIVFILLVSLLFFVVVVVFVVVFIFYFFTSDHLLSSLTHIFVEYDQIIKLFVLITKRVEIVWLSLFFFLSFFLYFYLFIFYLFIFLLLRNTLQFLILHP